MEVYFVLPPPASEAVQKQNASVRMSKIPKYLRGPRCNAQLKISMHYMMVSRHIAGLIPRFFSAYIGAATSVKPSGIWNEQSNTHERVGSNQWNEKM